MIFLNGTNEFLYLDSTTNAELDIQCNYVDVIANVSATPGSVENKSDSVRNLNIIDSPISGTSRQIKSIIVTNIGSSLLGIFSILKSSNSIFFQLTPIITLQPGESYTYESGRGFQINDVLSSTLTNDLHLGYQDWTAISSPTPPPADTLRLYARKISGRVMPKWTPPSGLDTPVQPALFGNNIVFWQPGATSGVMNGSIGTAIGAGVAVLPTTTNRYTMLRRSVFTVATGINLMNSYRSENMFSRGTGAGMGGFFFFARFGLNVWTPNNRFFVGLALDTTALLTANPSTKFNLLGFGVDQGDTEFSFIHNDGSGTAVKEPITGIGLATYNAYDAYIYCKPGDTTAYYRLDDITAGVTLVDTSVTGDLPVNTTMLNAVCAIGSGSNAGAAAASIGLNRMYIESDY